MILNQSRKARNCRPRTGPTPMVLVRGRPNPVNFKKTKAVSVTPKRIEVSGLSATVGYGYQYRRPMSESRSLLQPRPTHPNNRHYRSGITEAVNKLNQILSYSLQLSRDDKT